MNELSSFNNVFTLNLSNNEILEIEGIHSLKYLIVLNLNYNLIEHIDNIENMGIQELYL